VRRVLVRAGPGVRVSIESMRYVGRARLNRSRADDKYASMTLASVGRGRFQTSRYRVCEESCWLVAKGVHEVVRTTCRSVRTETIESTGTMTRLSISAQSVNDRISFHGR